MNNTRNTINTSNKMSIYHDLIKNIKNNNKDKIYGFMNQILNNH